MTAPLIQSNLTKYQPFVKWVGGKRGLLSQIVPLIPEEFNNYFEPFVGGGALFFELYSLGLLKDKSVYLFDINSELINAYNIVKSNPLDLVKELQKFKEKHSKEFYYEVRAWDREEKFLKRSKIERASRFIYLNKTCFNGLYRVNSKGYHNVPIGSYKNPNICDELVIYNASEALQNTKILNSSYKDVLSHAKANDFVYFDPPYYPLTPTSSFTSYNENAFLDKEQKELFEAFDKLAKQNSHVIHSNSDTDFIKELYKNYKIKFVECARFINSKGDGRKKIKEVIIKNIFGAA
jgi:DNA adenine methylase